MYPVKFDLTIKNPCVDQNYVTISAPTFTEKSYIIDSGSITFSPEGEFTVVTTPVVGHDLCGPFSFVAKYDSVVVDNDPLAYNEVTREFTASSTDGTLIGLTDKPYSVEVEFQNYPLGTYSTVATNSAASTIDFISPCIDYFTFSSNTQVDPASDNFSGATMTFTLTEFNMSPARCEVTYECTSVERVDEATSSIECSDLTFDGVIDG